MTVDQKAQVANAREEQQMSNENDEQNRAEVDCPRCAGCGQLADSEDREPWSVWMALPVGSALAVTMGLVKPEPCDECGGTGKVAALKTPDERSTAPRDQHQKWADPQGLIVETQPAGEHHTGTLDLTGEGNAPANPIPQAAVTALATHLAWSASWETYSEETQNTLIACTLPTALAALEAAYPAIRQQVAEEIAVAIERSEDDARRLEQQCQMHGDKQAAATWFDIATGYMRSAELAREIGAKA